MAAHHQHQLIEPGILERREAIFDLVNRSSQRAFKPGVRRQTEAVLQIDHFQEALRINIVAHPHGFDVAHQLLLLHGSQSLRQEIERADRGDGALGVRFGVLIIFAEQKVLLVAAQFEQLDEKVLGCGLHVRSMVGDCLIAQLGFRTDEMDDTNEQEPENANGSQRANLVGHADVR